MATTTRIKESVPQIRASPEPEVESTKVGHLYPATGFPSVVESRRLPLSQATIVSTSSAIVASLREITVPETVETTRLATVLTADVDSTPSIPLGALPTLDHFSLTISIATAVMKSFPVSTTKEPLTVTNSAQSSNTTPFTTNAKATPAPTLVSFTDTVESALPSFSKTWAPTTATIETRPGVLSFPSPLSPPLTLSPTPSSKPSIIQYPEIHTTVGAFTVVPLSLTRSSIKAATQTEKTAFTTRYVTTVSFLTVTTVFPQTTRVFGTMTTIYVTRTTTLLAVIPDPSQVLPLPFPSSSFTNQDTNASTIKCWQFIVGIVSALVIALVIAALLFRRWLSNRHHHQAIQDFLALSNRREEERGRIGRIGEGAGFMGDQSPAASGETASRGKGKSRQDYDDAMNGREFKAGSPSSTIVSGHDFGRFYLHYQPATAPPSLPESWYLTPTSPSFPFPPPPLAASVIPITREEMGRERASEGTIRIERGTETLHSFPLEFRTEPFLQMDRIHLKKSNTCVGGGGGWKSSKRKNRFQWPWKTLRSSSSAAVADTIASPSRQDPQRRPHDPHSLLIPPISFEAERPLELQQQDQKGKQRQMPRNPHGEQNSTEGFDSGDKRPDRRSPQGPYPMPRHPPPISVSTAFWEVMDENESGSGSGTILSPFCGSPSPLTVVEPESGPRVSTSTTVVTAPSSSSPIWSNTLITMVGDKDRTQANFDNQRTWPGPRGLGGGHGHGRGGQNGGIIIDNQSTLPTPLAMGLDQLEKFSKIELFRRAPQILLQELHEEFSSGAD